MYPVPCFTMASPMYTHVKPFLGSPWVVVSSQSLLKACLSLCSHAWKPKKVLGEDVKGVAGLCFPLPLLFIVLSYCVPPLVLGSSYPFGIGSKLPCPVSPPSVLKTQPQQGNLLFMAWSWVHNISINPGFTPREPSLISHHCLRHLLQGKDSQN